MLDTDAQGATILRNANYSFICTASRPGRPELLYIFIIRWIFSLQRIQWETCAGRFKGHYDSDLVCWQGNISQPGTLWNLNEGARNGVHWHEQNLDEIWKQPSRRYEESECFVSAVTDRKGQILSELKWINHRMKETKLLVWGGKVSCVDFCTLR